MFISKEIKELKKTGKDKNQEAKLSREITSSKLNSEAFVAFIINYPISFDRNWEISYANPANLKICIKCQYQEEHSKWAKKKNG